MSEKLVFDESFYLSQNPDVAAAGVDAYTHFMNQGWKEGRDPNAFFDTSFYLNQNPDVNAAGVNPLTHFYFTGFNEGRDPGVFFDTSYYLDNNADVAAAGVNPLQHYINQGATETFRDPNAFFDTSFYLSQNPDVATAGVNPLKHFVNQGWTEGRDPSAFFDTSFYLSTYQDVANAGINPLTHFLRAGLLEQRDPSAAVDVSALVDAGGDIATAIANGDLAAAVAAITPTAQSINGNSSSTTTTTTTTSSGGGGGGGAASNSDTLTLTATDGDTLSGGTGDDYFNATAATFQANDSIDGGADSDTLYITGGGSLNLNTAAQFDNMEKVTVTDTNGTTITLDNADQQDVTGNSGNDKFVIDVSAKTWAAGDTIDGSTGTDTLDIDGVGTADFTTASTEVDNIEVVDMTAAAAQTVTLDDDGYTVSMGGAAQSLTTGDGVDDITLADDDMTVDSGGGNDTIRIDNSHDWDGSDSLDAGAGTADKVVLTGAATEDYTAGTFDNVEIVDMTAATAMTVTLDDDGYTVSMGGAAQSLTTGDGDDTITTANDDMTVVTGNGTNSINIDGTHTWDASDNFTGGTGTDTVAITGGGTVNFSTLGTFTAFEAITTDNTATNITLGATAVTVTGGSGGNSITLGNANMTVDSGTGDDTVVIQDNQLDGNDDLDGQAGTDILSITGANGNVDFVGTATSVVGFEVITVDSDRITGTDTLVISDDLVGGATNDDLFLRTSGAGNYYQVDTSDVSAGEGDVIIDTGAAISLANATNRIVSDDSGASARDITISGGTGDDTFVMTNASFDENDSITGGGTGTDVLEFTDAVTIASGEWAQKSGIETIKLVDGTANTIAITDAFVEAADGGTADVVTLDNGTATVSLDASDLGADLAETVVIGGTGAVTLSAAATGIVTGAAVVNNIVTGAATNVIIAADGTLTTDTINATAGGGDTLRFSDAVDGGNLDFENTVTNVTGFENMTFAVSANNSTVILGDSLIQGTTFTVNTATGAAGTETYTLDTSNVSDTIDVAIAGGVATLSANNDRVLVSDAAASIDGAAGDDRFVYDDVDDLDVNDSITGGAHTNGDAIIIIDDTSTDLNIANGNDVDNVATVEFLAVVGDSTTGGDVTGTHEVDDTSEVDFSVIDGSVTLTAGTTVGAHTVLATGTISLVTAGAYTMADVSGTVAHDAGFAEVASVLTAYTGGKVTLAGDGEVTGGSGADLFNIETATAGNTTILGGTGDDTIQVDDNSAVDTVTINGGDGEDTLELMDGATLATTDFDTLTNIEIIKLTTGGTTITFTTGEASDITDADNVLTIDTDGNTLGLTAPGDDGAVVTVMGTGVVTLGGASAITTSGDTNVTLSTGNDSITGGTGADTFTVNDANFDANDEVAGGDGADTLVVDDANNGGITIADGVWANIATIETLKLSANASGTNAFTFGNNADTWIGGVANDEITFDLAGAASTTTITTTDLDSANTLKISDSADNVATFTMGTGGGSVTLVTGTAASITGGDGGDTVIGADQNDTISAGDGDDRITSGAGDDSLTGGNGNDQYTVAETDSNVTNKTEITDFNSSGTDKIVLSDAFFTFTSDDGTKNGATLTDNTDIYDTGVDFSVGDQSATTATFIYDRTDGDLYYDADGSGTGSSAVLVLNIANYSGGAGGNDYFFDANDFVGGA